MSSAKARPENAEVERRVERRLRQLHRKRWPPYCVVPSVVTIPSYTVGTTSTCPPSLSQPAPLSCKTTLAVGWRPRSFNMLRMSGR